MKLILFVLLFLVCGQLSKLAILTLTGTMMKCNKKALPFGVVLFIWGCSQAVRQQVLTLLCDGSNPSIPAKKQSKEGW